LELPVRKTVERRLSAPGAFVMTRIARSLAAKLTLAVLLMPCFTVVGRTVLAQQSSAPPAQDELSKSAESKRRQQAFLKYVEAQRLKGNAQQANRKYVWM